MEDVEDGRRHGKIEINNLRSQLILDQIDS